MKDLMKLEKTDKGIYIYIPIDQAVMLAHQLISNIGEMKNPKTVINKFTNKFVELMLEHNNG